MEGEQISGTASVNESAGSAAQGSGGGGSSTEGASTQATSQTEGGSSGKVTPPAGGDGGKAKASGGDAAGAEAPPAYKSNYKYKFNREERDIPEKYHGIIKSEADDKELRELFEKSSAFDEQKPRMETLKSDFSKLSQQHEGVLSQIQEARELYQRNDIDGFLSRLSIPPQKMLQWAMDKLSYEQLPADQKAQIDAQRNLERQNWELQRQQQSMHGQMQRTVLQARDMALTSELARPEIKAMVDAFDNARGRPGAFRQEVINRGQLAWFQSQGKVDLAPSQAVEQVIQAYGLKPGVQATPPAQAAGAGAPAQGGQKTGTIPNVGSGRSAAPIGRPKPKSIEDLKKLAAEM